VAPAAPASSAPPAVPAAQQASYKAPAPSAPAPTPTAQSDNASIQERLRAVAKEAFAKGKEETGTEFVAEPNEPAKKPDAPKAEKPEKPKAEKKTVFDAVATEDKPKAEAVAEPKDRFSDVQEPDGATETTKKGWKALKEKANAEIAAAEKRIADATAQLDTYRKASPAEQADYAKLKSDLQAAHDRLAVLDLSAHPDFRTQFVEPKNNALAKAHSLLTDNAVEGAPDIGALLDKPRADFSKALTEAAGKLPLFDQADFMASAREAYRLHGEEKSALSNANSMREQLVAKTAQQEKQSFEEVWRPFDQLVKPREVPDGADDEVKSEVQQYNDARAALRAEAERNIFGKQTPKDIATIGAKAATTDFLVRQVIPSMQREYKKLFEHDQQVTQELAAIQKAKNPGTFSGDAGKAPVDPSKMTFADSMRMAKEAAARGETIR
jgi:hypothetical protein